TLLINTLALIGSSWLEAVMMGLFGLLCSSLFRNRAVAVVVSFVVLYRASTHVQLMKLVENKWGRLLLFANTYFTKN
ncbi:ABC transporter permease, partial [Bacillus spizizenii]|nr:ABC transporter permease [Bacillus spizizenii]